MRPSFPHAAPVRALAALGRQGPRALAVMLLVGIALPSLGAALKPLLPASVFALLCLSFVRLDTGAFLGYMKRPRLVLLATAWSTLVVPLLVGLLCLACGLRENMPALYLGLTLQGVAPPMMAAPAMAALMGLDAALVMASMIASTALVPLSAPLFASLFLGGQMALSPLTIGLKLLLMLAGSTLLGLGIRRCVSVARIERHRDTIGGLNILILFVIVAALMESVASQALRVPLAVAGYSLLAFGMFAALLGTSALLFARAGRMPALSIAVMVAQRNLGLMVAASGGAMPSLTWMYFAVSQFPIYLSPQLLGRWAGRVAREDRSPD